MPLPRDPSNGVRSASISRDEIPRRARSSASVRPVGPAPTINTLVSYIVRNYLKWYAVRMSREKLQLTREKIAAAALSIADKEGFEAVSMRRVARELKAGTMSLYYYVRTKDDLIAVMDDA